MTAISNRTINTWISGHQKIANFCNWLSSNSLAQQKELSLQNQMLTLKDLLQWERKTILITPKEYSRSLQTWSSQRRIERNWSMTLSPWAERQFSMCAVFLEKIETSMMGCLLQNIWTSKLSTSRKWISTLSFSLAKNYEQIGIMQEILLSLKERLETECI